MQTMLDPRDGGRIARQAGVARVGASPRAAGRPAPVAQGLDPWMFPPGAARDDAAPATPALLRQVSERVRHLTHRYRAKAARLRARLVLGAEIALVDGAAERVRAALARGQADQAGSAGGMDHVRALQERQHDLVKELQHRTFNLMCLVRSIADMTIRSSRDFGDFDVRFSQRIDALARAQRLLSRPGGDGRVRFGELIRGELLAASVPNPGDGRATLDGADDIPLRAGVVQLLAMALHELTMDAVRQGGLGRPDGRLRVRWWADTDGQGQEWLHIDWRETGVAPSSRAAGDDDPSEGRTLIETALPFQLRARTHYVVDPDGLHCSIALPIADGG